MKTTPRPQSCISLKWDYSAAASASAAVRDEWQDRVDAALCATLPTPCSSSSDLNLGRFKDSRSLYLCNFEAVCAALS